MQTELDILHTIHSRGIEFPPLHIKVAGIEVLVPTSQGRMLLDALLHIHWQGHLFKFGAEIRTRYTPQALEQNIHIARRYNDQYSKLERTYPMIIVPYLNESALARLEQEAVSGIDLCGNGVIVIPNKMLVWRTGFPNKYPSSEPLKNVYRGNSSLVARAFLAQSTYSSVNDLHLYIKQRGGSVALSTVSKALSVLETDLIVGRGSGLIRLLQPEKLIEKLSANYQPPKISRKFQARYLTDATAVMERLVSNAQANHARYILTGASSINLYTTMAKPDVLSLYCTDINALLSLRDGEQPAPLEEATRFVDIELVETDNELVYFDSRQDARKLRDLFRAKNWLDIWLYMAASPVQTYLEMINGGPREKQTAEDVKQVILNEIGKIPL